MACKELFLNAAKQERRTKIRAPIRLFPRCHPNAFVDVFADHRSRTITLVCGACDRTMEVIHVRKESKQDAKLEQ